MKDFADSYEQKKWHLASKYHKEISELRDMSKYNNVKEICQRRIDEIESRYPCLKTKKETE